MSNSTATQIEIPAMMDDHGKPHQPQQWRALPVTANAPVKGGAKRTSLDASDFTPQRALKRAGKDKQRSKAAKKLQLNQQTPASQSGVAQLLRQNQRSRYGS